MNSADNSATLFERLGPSGYAVTFAAVVIACLALGASVSILLATSHHPIARVQMMRTGNSALGDRWRAPIQGRLGNGNVHSRVTFHALTA